MKTFFEIQKIKTKIKKSTPKVPKNVRVLQYLQEFKNEVYSKDSAAFIIGDAVQTKDKKTYRDILSRNKINISTYIQTNRLKYLKDCDYYNTTIVVKKQISETFGMKSAKALKDYVNRLPKEAKKYIKLGAI
jgi:hypothetical protein